MLASRVHNFQPRPCDLRVGGAPFKPGCLSHDPPLVVVVGGPPFCAEPPRLEPIVKCWAPRVLWLVGGWGGASRLLAALTEHKGPPGTRAGSQAFGASGAACPVASSRRSSPLSVVPRSSCLGARCVWQGGRQAVRGSLVRFLRDRGLEAFIVMGFAQAGFAQSRSVACKT